MFERAYLEISNICNLQCSFCPEVEREKKIISLEDFRSFAEQLKPLTKQICLHLMGEPLGHPQFKEIAEICDELELRVFLTTNGTLLKRHFETLLHWKALDQINFSVHSFFANPQKISLEQYLSPIMNFCELATLNHNSYYINIRLWNLAQAQTQRDENRLVFNLLSEKFKISLNENVDILMGKSKKIFGHTYIHFDTEFIWPSLKNEFRSEQGSCYGLRKQVAIHANGDVVPCCLDKEAVLKLGSLKTQKLNEILNSSKALNIKQGFETGQLREEMCQKCQYADRFKFKK